VTGGLRFAEVGEGDLPDLLEISLSHPDFLALTEGSAGEHGHYDLEMLQRDWWLARWSRAAGSWWAGWPTAPRRCGSTCSTATRATASPGSAC